MARNILVVEDDRNISDLIRMYLRGIGDLYMHYENVLLGVWIRRGNIFGKASPVGIRPCFKKDRLATA